MRLFLQIVKRSVGGGYRGDPEAAEVAEGSLRALRKQCMDRRQLGGFAS
jgi:hypothetical protein